MSFPAVDCGGLRWTVDRSVDRPPLRTNGGPRWTVLPMIEGLTHSALALLFLLRSRSTIAGDLQSRIKLLPA